MTINHLSELIIPGAFILKLLESDEMLLFLEDAIVVDLVDLNIFILELLNLAIRLGDVVLKSTQDAANVSLQLLFLLLLLALAHRLVNLAQVLLLLREQLFRLVCRVVEHNIPSVLL